MDTPGVDPAALKKAEDGNGLIMRLVEMHGRDVEFEITLAWNPEKTPACDLREEPLDREARRIVRGKVQLRLRPYVIGTWRMD